MKKLLLGIAALAFIFASTPVMAAAPKVPTNLCSVWSSIFSMLAIKPGPVLKTAGGNVKNFIIHGHNGGSVAHPVSGNGYVIPGTTIFHMSYTGGFLFGGSMYSGVFEVYHDFVVNNGTIYAHLERDDGVKFTGAFPFVASNCQNLPVAAMTVGDDLSSPFGQ